MFSCHPASRCSRHKRNPVGYLGHVNASCHSPHLLSPPAPLQSNFCRPSVCLGPPTVGGHHPSLPSQGRACQLVPGPETHSAHSVLLQGLCLPSGGKNPGRKIGKAKQVLKGLDLIRRKEGKEMFQSGNSWKKMWVSEGKGWKWDDLAQEEGESAQPEPKPQPW